MYPYIKIYISNINIYIYQNVPIYQNTSYFDIWVHFEMISIIKFNIYHLPFFPYSILYPSLCIDLNMVCFLSFKLFKQ